MIDWERRALELAEEVKLGNEEESTYEDLVRLHEMAENLIELGKREGEARKKFMEHWRCPDKKEREKLYKEYLEMIR